MKQRYREIFFAYEGIGPHECYFCWRVIDTDALRKRDRLEIHHLDHNRENGDISNLVAVHGGCHAVYHAHESYANHRGFGTLAAEIQRQKTMEILRTGFWSQKVQRQAGRTGGTRQAQQSIGMFNPELRKELNRRGGFTAGPINGKKTQQYRDKCSCGLISTPMGIGRHQKFSHHQGKERLTCT